MSPSSKPQIDQTDRSAIAIAGTGLAIAAIAASGLLFKAGFIPEPAQAAPEPVAPQKLTAQVSAKSPAALAVPAALLESPGTGIDPDGSIMGSANTPWPMDCAPEDSPVPLASLSRAMSTNAGRIQVTVQSYAPGAGAAAFQDQSASAPSCRGGAGFSKVGQAGTEQAIWNGSRSGTRVNGATFRAGDVIVHVSGQGPQTAADIMATTLEGMLSKVCADPSSTAGDWTRNPLSPDPGPWLVPATAEIDDPGLPQVPQDAGYEPTEIPANDLPVPEPVEPMDTPQWPVWPLMPEPLEEPKAPVVPVAEPVLEEGIQVTQQDTDGPGCGWDWTGQAPAIFDGWAAYLSNLKTTLTAMDTLTAGAEQWQGEISGYWKGVANYRDDVEAWTRYAAEVAEVNQAWEAIAEEWDRYQHQLEVWEANEADIAQVAEAKADSMDLWQQNLRQCRIDNGQPVLDSVEDAAEAAAAEVANAAPAVFLPASPMQPTPAPESSEEPSAPATDTPDDEPTDEPVEQPADEPESVDSEPLDCAAVFPRPDILDMTGPEPYDKPSEPADPRPENWEQVAAGEVEEGEGR